MKSHNVLHKGLILSVVLAATSSLFAATSFTQVTEVNPSDPADGQTFGGALAISDDVAVVGASSNPNPSPFVFPGSRDGAAYVYVRSNASWVFQQKLVASDSTGTNSVGNQFGFAVEVSGNTIAVGSPSRRANGKSGAVYIFTRPDTNSPWAEQAIITSSTPRPFGTSLALRGGTLVVGGLEDSLSGGGTSDAGVAFVFVRSGNDWVEQGNLMRTDVPQAHTQYGVSVSIRGNTVVVGAEEVFGGPSAVYVFSRQGTAWTEETKLSSPNNSGTFGNSVSLWGNSLMVGDPNSNAALIYEHAGHDWQLQQTLTGDPGTAFGYAVAQREESLLIGARNAAPSGVQTGAAYLYGFDEETWTWSLLQTLSPADGQPFDNFGRAVGLSSTAGIVGAPRHAHAAGLQSGAAYIYEP